MSILIKGIELPEKVQVLELHPDGKVFTRKGYLVGEAVELSDTHGRLVDADALIRDHFSPEHRIALSEANKTWMRKIINDAPTIVEVEGENG